MVDELLAYLKKNALLLHKLGVGDGDGVSAPSGKCNNTITESKTAIL